MKNQAVLDAGRSEIETGRLAHHQRPPVPSQRVNEDLSSYDYHPQNNPGYEPYRPPGNTVYEPYRPQTNTVISGPNGPQTGPQTVPETVPEGQRGGRLGGLVKKMKEGPMNSQRTGPPA
jgi:hypothetical protein